MYCSIVSSVMCGCILMVIPYSVQYIIGLPIRHVLITISSNSIMIGSRNVGCRKSATKVRNSAKSAKMSMIGYKPLFYNRIMNSEYKYTCILLCLPFGFVFWQLYRLCLLWVSRWVMHNSVWPTLYRYNYSETTGVFILGR